MNVVVEEVNACRRTLKIEVPAEEISTEYEQALNGFKAHASLPGFRPGKAPANLVKAKYHKDIINHLRDNLLPKSYNEAITEKEFDVVQIIEVDDDVDVQIGEPMTYSVTVDIKPEIVLPEYKGIALTRDVEDVTESDIEEAIKGLLDRQAKFEDVTDQPVAAGDLVSIDFSATSDGTPVKDIDVAAESMGEGSDFWCRADDQAFVPEIGEVLPGLNVGEETEVSAQMADDFVVEALQGKTIDYKVTVKGIRAKILPELDEEMLAKLGVEDEDGLKQRVKEDLEQQNKNADENRLRREIETFLMGNTTFELPESVVAREAARQVQQIVSNATQQGMSEDQFAENREEIMNQANEGAMTSTKLRYILTEIATKENITTDEQELKQEMMYMAYSYGMQPGELEKRLNENGTSEEFRTDVIVRKAMQFLVDAADISE